MRELLEKICNGQALTRMESRTIFSEIASGTVDDVMTGALLIALRTRGESAEEIAGAAEALLDRAVPIDANGLDLSDICGTGGDGAHTINISTAAAIVAAASGLHVAKHGNRCVSSSCGSADVLERCGVKIDAAPDVLARNLLELGICFIFAPAYHPGMKHASRARSALRVRTIFNLLGPLVNPARPAYQVVGVYDESLVDPIAHTLMMLGRKAALVVHGAGMDELAVHGETTCAVLRDGNITKMTVKPEDVGLKRTSLAELKGGGADENARALVELLRGESKPAQRSAVALNAGALIWIAGGARTIADGTAVASEIIASGGAAEKLTAWVERSNYA